MKRLLKNAIALCAAIAGLGLVACSTGSSNSENVVEGSDATLKFVKFGAVTANMGTPNANINDAVEGSVTILSGANVTVTAEATAADARIRAALIEAGSTDAPVWDVLGFPFDFTSAGDSLVLEVTAGNGTTRLYYKINVTVADVARESLTIGGVNISPLPAPGATWQEAAAGFILFKKPVSEQGAGTVVVAKPLVAGSSVKYGHAIAGEAPVFNNTSTITFVDPEFLYIEVTSADGGKGYYKVEVNFQQSGTIRYGSPVIKADEHKYIDPLWDDEALEEYLIEKIVPVSSTGETSPDYFEDPTTKGVGKAYWDEYGLYVYVKVIDPDVSATTGSGSTAHLVDSVELFVNEAYPSTSYSAGGSQYRVGANGERSGEGASPAALEKLNKTSAWKTDDGYIVIFQAPWRLRNQFFNETSYRNDWEFGFELQINACTGASRDGVMVWNNIAHTNYQNATDYGVAKLIGHIGSYNFPPVEPRITQQPSGSQQVAGSEVTLTVAATKSEADTGVLSYQWYSAPDATTAGTPIAGATSASYTFMVGGVDTYYYAVVTNTIGILTESVTSNRAGIRVGAVADWVFTFPTPIINETAIPDADVEVLEIDLMSIKPDFDGSLFDKVTWDIKWYDSAMNEIAMPGKWSMATLKWQRADNTSLNEEYNFGQSTLTQRAIPVAAQASTLAKLLFQSGNASASSPGGSNYYDLRFIEVIGFTFHVAPQVTWVIETIDVDVTEVYAGTIGSAFAAAVQNVPDDGAATLTFESESAANDTYGFIPLTLEQAARINSAKTIEINIQGSSSDDEIEFQYYLGNAAAASSWNGVNGNNGIRGIFPELVGNKEAQWGNKNVDNCSCFILRLRTETTEDVVVNITSITITVEVPE